MTEGLGEFFDFFEQADVAHQTNHHQPRFGEAVFQIVESRDRQQLQTGRCQLLALGCTDRI